MTQVDDHQYNYVPIIKQSTQTVRCSKKQPT